MGYLELCQLKGIETLEARRVAYIDKFIIMTINNGRFSGKWFPQRAQGNMELRTRREFIETRARTQRYFNSPLAYMRRRANIQEASGENLGQHSNV